MEAATEREEATWAGWLLSEREEVAVGPRQAGLVVKSERNQIR